MILYADVLFAVNFIMDYLALYAASAVLRLGKGRVRMACGALIGAAYCIVKIYASFPEPLAAVLVSLVMCFAALWNGKILTYIKAVILFYAVSMLFGGVMTFLYESVRRYRSAPLFRDGLTPGLFIAAVGILFVFIFAGSRIVSHGVFVKNVRVRVKIDGKCGDFRLLCDSGNLLRDPYNGLPVLVLDAKSLDTLLGKDGFHRDIGKVLPLDAKRKFRYIPVHTSCGDGALPAFLPDEIILLEKHRERQIQAMIAVATGACCGENDGIIPLAAVCA